MQIPCFVIECNYKIHRLYFLIKLTQKLESYLKYKFFQLIKKLTEIFYKILYIHFQLVIHADNFEFDPSGQKVSIVPIRKS